MVCLYNILTDTEPPRARPGPPRPSSASGGPPAAARCGGVTNPTTEHRDAVGRSEAQLGVCIAHPGLSPGPINRRLRRRGHEVLFTPAQAFMQHSMVPQRHRLHHGCGYPRLLSRLRSCWGSLQRLEQRDPSRSARDRPLPTPTHCATSERSFPGRGLSRCRTRRSGCRSRRGM